MNHLLTECAVTFTVYWNVLFIYILSLSFCSSLFLLYLSAESTDIQYCIACSIYSMQYLNFVPELWILFLENTKCIHCTINNHMHWQLCYEISEVFLLWLALCMIWKHCLILSTDKRAMAWFPKKSQRFWECSLNIVFCVFSFVKGAEGSKKCVLAAVKNSK